MNVNNRKMFKPRPARNQLNQLGGIMASSPQLVDTVARFQQGGNVSLAQMQQANDPRFFARLGANVANLPAAAYDTLVGFPASTLQNAASAVQYSPFGRALGMSEYGETAPPTVGAQPAQSAIRDVLQANQPLTPEQVALRNQPAGIGVLAPAGAEDAAMSAQLGQSVFGEGYSLPEEVDPFVMPGVTPPPETPTEQEQPAVTEPPTPPQAPVQTDAELAADSADNAEIVAAAKRGELGAAEQVKAVVQQGTPQEQEQSLSQLMTEFTQNAPEFKGADRGLAMAKIGFAMAAGQSPDAITNIAKALNEGADELIKDKRERDSFDRQVKLSALQYGLGEIGKQRAQDRLDERTFKEYAAGEDGIEYNGVTYDEGETILVSQSDILANGGKLPSGLMDKTVYASNVKATADRTKAITDALKEQARLGEVSDSVLDKRLETYKGAADTVISAEAGIQLTENAILDVAEGRVTGINNALQDLMNRTASGLGIDLGKQYESVADFRSDVRQVFQEMIPVTLGQAQAANSISNRDVEFLADAFITAGALENGVFSLAFMDEDILTKQLQGAIRKMRTAQQQAIGQMTSVEKTLSGRTVAGEKAESFLEPYRVTVEPFLPTETGTRGKTEQGQTITSTLGFPFIGKDEQGRNRYDLTGGQ